jgi:hypothetical protein
MNSTVPCTSILVVGSRIDGPDDINSPALQCPATVHAVQCSVYNESSTVLCAVPLLQCLILIIYFRSNGSVCKARYCLLVPYLQRGTGSLSKCRFWLAARLQFDNMADDVARRYWIWCQILNNRFRILKI